MLKKTLFLIGSRGSGKTSLGRILSEYLGESFVDLDQVLQERSGRTIASLVQEKGWDFFRMLETQTLFSETLPAQIVATGGGIVLAPENRRFLHEHGIVIYLSVPAQELCRRLLASPLAEQRPPLTRGSLQEEVEATLAERESLYLEIAHFVVDGTQPLEVMAHHLVTDCLTSV